VSHCRSLSQIFFTPLIYLNFVFIQFCFLFIANKSARFEIVFFYKYLINQIMRVLFIWMSILLICKGKTIRKERAAVANINRLWPNGVIPFIINDTFPGKMPIMPFWAFSIKA
jgi:hypothetical protein